MQRTEDELSYDIIGAAIEVHQTLGGPGLLESVYQSSLCHELIVRGLKVQTQLIIPVKYKNAIVRDPLCLDILVESKVIIEVKATEKEQPIHQARATHLSSINWYEIRASYQLWPRICKGRHS